MGSSIHFDKAAFPEQPNVKFNHHRPSNFDFFVNLLGHFYHIVDFLGHFDYFYHIVNFVDYF